MITEIWHVVFFTWLALQVLALILGPPVFTWPLLIWWWLFNKEKERPEKKPPEKPQEAVRKGLKLEPFNVKELGDGVEIYSSGIEPITSVQFMLDEKDSKKLRDWLNTKYPE